MNSGKSDLVINSVTTTETAGNEFSQNNNCGTIQPGSSCIINATFTPELPYANKTAILAIASNDPKKPLLNVKLSGKVPPPIISVTPSSLNFGKLPAGTLNASKPVTITNKGLSDLLVGSIHISGINPEDFTVSGNCDAIQNNMPCTFNVLFAPLVSNINSNASLDISSNDPKKSTVSLKLTGNSWDAPTVSSWDSSTWGNATWGP